MSDKSWLRRRAEEARQQMFSAPTLSREVDSIEEVAREFAERVASVIVNGRHKDSGWALDIWGGDPDSDPDRFVITEAIAAADALDDADNKGAP